MKKGPSLAISARKSVNLTQRELAKFLNVSIDAVQDWERARPIHLPRPLAGWRVRLPTTSRRILVELCHERLSREASSATLNVVVWKPEVPWITRAEPMIP